MGNQELDTLIELAKQGGKASASALSSALGVSRFNLYRRAYVLGDEGCIAEDGRGDQGMTYTITGAGWDALRDYRRALEIELEVIQRMIAAPA